MAVTSTVIHSVTCGLVKADWLIAVAIILRTPLIGSRVSRSPVRQRGCVTVAARPCRSGRAAPAAPTATSSRVIDPTGPGAGQRRTGRHRGPWPACAPAASPARVRRWARPARTAGRAPRRGRRRARGAGRRPAPATRRPAARPATGRRRARTHPAAAAGSGAPASVLGEAEPRRARRIGPRSALIRPTRDAPSIEPEAAGLERSMSAGSTWPARAFGTGLLRPSRGRGRTRSAAAAGAAGPRAASVGRRSR